MLRKFNIFIKNWLADDPFTQSFAVAYCAVFSLPALLIILMAIASQFFEQRGVEQQVMHHIHNILGQNAADNISGVIKETQQGDRDRWAMIVGFVTLLFGATGLFLQLQRALNRIWDVEVKKSAGLLTLLKKRVTALGVILALGFLLLVSLAVTATLTLLGEWVAARFSPDWMLAISILNMGLSFGTITVLFGLIYKVLPDAHVEWRYALMGGALSALLFNIGEYVLSYYFELAKPQSAFGAAGSIVLLMLWVSYSSLILLIGGEFAKTTAEKRTGRKTRPTGIAKKKIRPTPGTQGA